jgi:nicotinamidase/pyrazinamidase
MPSVIAIGPRDVLVVIDVKTDLLPDGSMAIAKGDAIAPLVDRLARAFANVVFMQGLHPHSQTAPAPLDPDAILFDSVTPGDHVRAAGTLRAGRARRRLERRLGLRPAFLILNKGAAGAVQSHSLDSEAQGETTRGLAARLKAGGIRRVVACGLASDYCGARLMVARAAGLETFVIDDA